MRTVYCLLALAAVAAVADETIMERFGRDPQLWQLDAPNMARRCPGIRFAWVDQEKTTARTTPEWSGGHLPFLGREVAEVLIRFKDDTINRVVFNIYTRGDQGDIGMDAFKEMTEEMVLKLDKYTDAERQKLRGYRRKDIRQSAMRWIKPPLVWDLEYSYSRGRGRDEDRPEYLRLTVKPVDSLGEDQQPDEEMEPEDQVRTDSNGDVWIPTVPMVDQGQKGYCAVAVTERVMRYYGLDVDQHKLAQVAASDGERGTDPDSLVRALDRYSVQFGARVHEIDKADWFTSHGIKKMVRDYNNMARRMDRPKLDRPDGQINLGVIFQSMDPEVFLAMQTRSSVGRRGFWRDITREVDDGIPVMWSVMLGFVPEPSLPQVFGGHMRLIIGYNEETGEIIYTDSWGRGHEKKRMKADHAQAITTGLFTLTPR